MKTYFAAKHCFRHALWSIFALALVSYQSALLARNYRRAQTRSFGNGVRRGHQRPSGLVAELGIRINGHRAVIEATKAAGVQLIAYTRRRSCHVGCIQTGIGQEGDVPCREAV